MIHKKSINQQPPSHLNIQSPDHTKQYQHKLHNHHNSNNKFHNNNKKNKYNIGSFIQFSPYLLFIAVYSVLYFYMLQTSRLGYSQTILYGGLPLFAIFITTIYAFFTFQEKLSINQKFNMFLYGVSHPAAIHYYILAIFIAVFTHITGQTNGILTTASLGLIYIPASLIMPIIFCLGSIITAITKSFLMTILIAIPIVDGIARSLHINSGFIIATLIGGALAGKHLVEYCTQIKNLQKDRLCTPWHVLTSTTWAIFPAIIYTLFILSQAIYESIDPKIIAYLYESLTLDNYLSLAPHITVGITSFLGFDIIIALIFGSCLGIVLEIGWYKMNFLDTIATMFSGFYTDTCMITIVLCYMGLAGLTKIIKNNGGFHYIFDSMQLTQEKNQLIAQIKMILLAIMLPIFILFDDSVIHIFSSQIKKIAHQTNLSSFFIFNLLYIITTTMQTLVPYGIIMMMATKTSRIVYTEILPYMIYPVTILLCTMISLIISYGIEKKIKVRS